MGEFDHKKLGVYRVSLEFAALVPGIMRSMPMMLRPVRDQLLRAAVSVPLNIAEGASEHSPGAKARSYRIARASAGECSAFLDTLVAMQAATPELTAAPEKLLQRIAAMLTLMARTQEARTTTPSPSPGAKHRSPSPGPQARSPNQK